MLRGCLVLLPIVVLVIPIGTIDSLLVVGGTLSTGWLFFWSAWSCVVCVCLPGPVQSFLGGGSFGLCQLFLVPLSLFGLVLESRRRGVVVVVVSSPLLSVHPSSSLLRPIPLLPWGACLAVPSGHRCLLAFALSW